MWLIGMQRDRVAVLLAFATILGLGLTFLFAKDTQFLMPGRLTSAHGSIGKCSTCHASSGSSNFSWIHGLAASDQRADSKSCLTCHAMPDTAFNAHGASLDVLKKSTERLAKIAAETPAPYSAFAQNAASPSKDLLASGLNCATCHKEHQGSDHKLDRISNEQCRSCHVVKFDSFDGNHPAFDGYPFKQRTAIIFDHAGHFGKNFAESVKENPSRNIPTTCSNCHSSGKEKRVMDVAPFEQTCSGCHVDQITGKSRVSGPKGIAFLALPGLDLPTLKKRKASIGEWPEASEAGLTPFMKVIIGRNERGSNLIRSVGNLNLQDLSKANDAQIDAVAALAWEIKALFHSLIKSRASDVLADMTVGNAGKLAADQIVDLTASLPLEVIISAQQQWLPNLGTEMANRPDKGELERNGWITTITKSKLALAQDGQPIETKSVGAQVASTSTSVEPEAVPKAKAGKDAAVTGGPPKAKSADQTDDLLFPTADELRAMKAGGKVVTKAAAAERAAEPATPASASPESPAPEAQSKAVPVAGIKTDVEPENWAAYGGWYRQDFAILYRPTGHKERFIQAWLRLTGPFAPTGDAGPAATVFDLLSAKDAQGACTKCHSVDDRQGAGRVVNFSAPTAAGKKGRFTAFSHEPHFGVVGDRGCQTCHTIKKGAPYLESYKQGNPQSFASGFTEVKKETCQTCHADGKARQDCLLCHSYHVNGAITPIMNTKIPDQ